MHRKTARLDMQLETYDFFFKKADFLSMFIRVWFSQPQVS